MSTLVTWLHQLLPQGLLCPWSDHVPSSWPQGSRALAVMPALSHRRRHGGPWAWEGQLGARGFDHIPLSASENPASAGSIEGAQQVLQELWGPASHEGPFVCPQASPAWPGASSPARGGAGCGARVPARLSAARRRGWASGAARARVPLRATSGLCEPTSSHIPGQH